MHLRLRKLQWLAQGHTSGTWELNQGHCEYIFAGRNINNLRYADDTTRMAESEEELKSLLMKGEWKSWPKAQHSENEDHGIWSHHFMENRWGNSGNSVRLYFLGSKITVDGDCSHEIKRCLLLGRNVMTNLDSILKSRDITLPTKFRLVKDVRVGLWRKLSAKELMLLKCGVGEDSCEYLGLQGDPTNPFWRRSTLGFLWKEWC